MLSELLRSAFPWRCFVAVWRSGIRLRLVICAVHEETVQICFVRGGTASVTGQCSFSNRNVQSSPHSDESALHLFIRRGRRIQSAEYKLCRSMCGHLREALSFWIWLLLNWHCSSPHSEWGCSSTAMAVWGEGRAGVTLYDVSFKHHRGPTVSTFTLVLTVDYNPQAIFTNCTVSVVSILKKKDLWSHLDPLIMVGYVPFLSHTSFTFYCILENI